MRILLIASVLGVGMLVGGFAALFIPAPHAIYTRPNTMSTIDSEEPTGTSTAPTASTTNTLAQSESAYAKPVYKKAVTTVFWVGEGADASNDFISNTSSAWSTNWQEQFGGYDDPNTRCGLLPCTFTPKENPFYIALPYNDLTDDGVRKASASNIPWFQSVKHRESVVKNRWIEIRYRGKSCYGQWEDTGPNEYDDFDYVFGTAEPKNVFGLKAGLDVSPAIRDCLSLSGNNVTEWRFIEESEVPPGPWRDVITTSDVAH